MSGRPGRGGVFLAALAIALGLAGFVASRWRAPARIEGNSGTATVAIFDDGQPLADRWVVFHDPDGSVTATMKSGADGKASSTIRAGGMISVAYGTSIHQLVTVLGVQPGDEVLVGEDEDDEKGSGDMTALARVVLPGFAPQATRYGVNLGVGVTDVGDVSRPLRLPIPRRFVRAPQHFDVLGVALDAAGDTQAWTFAAGALDGRDGGAADVVLPAWSTDFRPYELDLEHAPATLTTARGELAFLSGPQRFDHAARETTLASGGAQLHFSVPRPLGDTASYRIELAYETGPDHAVLVRRVSAIPEKLRIDLGEALLPRISAARMEASSERSRPFVRWAASGDTSKADAFVVQLAWPETKENVWTILAPPTMKPRFQLPALPAALADWRPDARAVRPAVALVDASGYASYDDVRKKGIMLFAETPEEDASLRFSMTGKVDF